MTTAYLKTNEMNLKAMMLRSLITHYFQMISYRFPNQQEHLNSEIII